MRRKVTEEYSEMNIVFIFVVSGVKEVGRGQRGRGGDMMWENGKEIEEE